MAWQRNVIVAVVFVIALAAIPTANAATNVYLAEGQKVVDAKGNQISGNGLVTVGPNLQTAEPPCSLLCKIKSIFNVQSVFASTEITSGGNLAEGQYANIGDYLKPTPGEHTQAEINKMMFTDISFRDKDGSVKTIHNAPHGTGFDFTPLNENIGGSGISGKAVYSTLINIPSPTIPTPAGCFWILNNAGGGNLNCGESGFFQAGSSEYYKFTIDVNNGLDVQITNANAFAPLNGTYCFDAVVNNRIAEGIAGGLLVQRKSKTYLQETEFNKTEQTLFKSTSNLFHVCGPTDKLGIQEIKLVPYIKVDVPYIALEVDKSATSGSGVKPVQRYNTWYGTDDTATVLEYEVLFPEQIGPARPGTKIYTAPYSKIETKPIPTFSNSSTRNAVLIGLGILAAAGAAIYLMRRN